MKVIVHAGMHKTGSTSIQETFTRHDLGHVRYFRWRIANHIGLLALLFFEPVEEYWYFKRHGHSREELLQQREKWLESFKQDLTRPGASTCLLSAEEITHPQSPSALAPLKAFLEKYSDDIQIVAYIRSPVGFMQSLFQERVKNGNTVFNPRLLWPGYRQRFEPLDRVFGRENVTLRKFDPKTLKNGSVVDDLAEFAGIALPPGSAGNANKSLSLEALALLFVQRKFGRGRATGFPVLGDGATGKNDALRKFLAAIGKEKIRFAPELVLPVIEARKADLEWMERRLSEPLLDIPKNSNGPLLRSEQDLLSVADRSFPELEALVPDPPADATLSTRENMIRKMESFLW